jgi:hypothetical protein
MKARSVARGGGGFTVAPSPLNGVKLELGLVCLGGVLLWLLHGRIVASGLGQLLLLAGYGLTGCAWVVYRARAVLRRQHACQRVGGGAQPD